MSNFKPGDIVICINNQETDLILNKQYRIYNITTDSDPRAHQDYIELLVLYEDTKHGYFSHRFIKLKENRIKKLNNIYEKYNQ